jgi:hypothetical protein
MYGEVNGSLQLLYWLSSFVFMLVCALRSQTITGSIVWRTRIIYNKKEHLTRIINEIITIIAGINEPKEPQ